MKKLCCWPTLNIKVKVSYLNWQVKQTAGDGMLPALKITIENHSSLCQANTLCFYLLMTLVETLKEKGRSLVL